MWEILRRRAILSKPPDVFLTTPESLEVMLGVAFRVEHPALFSGIQAVVIDEVHAFAGDDRGWHLLTVLERVVPGSRAVTYSAWDYQRLIGNPDDLLEWPKLDQ